MIARNTPQLIGEAPAWLEAQEHVSRLAPLERPALIIGERGTGKELIGERLHFLSNRWDGPFIKVNCAALSETLLDSELFGHERGAFTGATERRVGRFELADGGTLFLDEIATASPQVQEKLLRVVEYGEFQRLGGERVLQTDVRILAATNVDLPSRAAAGRFRADLLDRLAFDVVTLPPLRARPGDISLLADYFARRIAIEMSEDFPGFSGAAIAQLEQYEWPGNVRELRNVAQRIAYRSLLDGDRGPIDLRPQDLDPFASPFRPQSPDAGHGPGPRTEDKLHRDMAGAEPDPLPPLPLSFDKEIKLYETRLIDAALAETGGHQGKTAKALGLSYDQLRGLLRKHNYGRGAGKPAPVSKPPRPSM